MGTAVEFEDLSRGCGEWLRGSGPEADIVICSRIRLARNLAAYPVHQPGQPARPGRDRAHAARSHPRHPRRRRAVVSERASAWSRSIGSFWSSGSSSAASTPKVEGARGVAIDPQAADQPDGQRGGPPAHPGHAQRARPLGRLGATSTPSTTCSSRASIYAFHERFGYLTACPTNVGTGMRVSVMLHLPALVLTREIEKVFRACKRSTSRSAGCTARARSRPATSTRSATRPRSAAASARSSLSSATATRSCPESSNTSAKPARPCSISSATSSKTR